MVKIKRKIIIVKKMKRKKEKVIMSFPYLISFHSGGKPFAPNLNWERNCSRIFSIKIKLQSHKNISTKCERGSNIFDTFAFLYP